MQQRQQKGLQFLPPPEDRWVPPSQNCVIAIAHGVNFGRLGHSRSVILVRSGIAASPLEGDIRKTWNGDGLDRILRRSKCIN